MTNNNQTDAERASAITYAILIQLLRFALFIGSGIFMLFWVLPFVLFTLLPVVPHIPLIIYCLFKGHC